jgi:FtsP/CotA-like multicopper oxidase with cupredoxin domain
MRTWITMLGLVLVGGLLACGGGATDEEGAMEADTTAVETETTQVAGLTTPSWMLVDQTAQTVKLEISAGAEAVNNYWNFNGLYAGNGAITVPQGYAVTINFTNAEPAPPHSLGISEKMDAYPAMFENPQPAFAGAITPDATTGSAPGATASITFTADAAGEYAMVCYVPGHAGAGMVIPFTVAADGSAGVTQ